MKFGTLVVDEEDVRKVMDVHINSSDEDDRIRYVKASPGLFKLLAYIVSSIIEAKVKQLGATDTKRIGDVVKLFSFKGDLLRVTTNIKEHLTSSNDDIFEDVLDTTRILSRLSKFKNKDGKSVNFEPNANIIVFGLASLIVEIFEYALFGIGSTFTERELLFYFFHGDNILKDTSIFFQFKKLYLDYTEEYERYKSNPTLPIDSEIKKWAKELTPIFSLNNKQGNDLEFAWYGKIEFEITDVLNGNVPLKDLRSSKKGRTVRIGISSSTGGRVYVPFTRYPAKIYRFANNRSLKHDHVQLDIDFIYEFIQDLRSILKGVNKKSVIYMVDESSNSQLSEPHTNCLLSFIKRELPNTPINFVESLEEDKYHW